MPGQEKTAFAHTERRQMMEKYAARKVKQEIGKILLTVWDPIGVNTYPEARDEYEAYVNPVFELLVRRASDQQLLAYLSEQVSVTMGLSGASRNDMAATVKALRALSLETDNSDPLAALGMLKKK